jgi:hypothetical protein
MLSLFSKWKIESLIDEEQVDCAHHKFILSEAVAAY